MLDALTDVLCGIFDFAIFDSATTNSGWRKAFVVLSLLATIAFAVWWFGGFTLW